MVNQNTTFFGDGFDGIQPLTLIKVEEVVKRVERQADFIRNLNIKDYPEEYQGGLTRLKHWTDHEGSYLDLIYRNAYYHNPGFYDNPKYYLYACIDKNFIVNYQTDWHIQENINSESLKSVKEHINSDIPWEVINEYNTVSYECYSSFKKFGTVFPVLSDTTKHGDKHSHKQFFCAAAGYNVPTLFPVNEKTETEPFCKFIYRGAKPYWFDGKYLDIVLDVNYKTIEYRKRNEAIF